MIASRLYAMILVALGATAAASRSIDAMRWHRRILLVASPAPHDPATLRQRRILAGWRREAADRDISLVEITGASVTGASDEAAALRRRFRMPDDSVSVLLIGKDGHVALRSPGPIAAEQLQATIDAMPMRQAGER